MPTPAHLSIRERNRARANSLRVDVGVLEGAAPPPATDLLDQAAVVAVADVVVVADLDVAPFHVADGAFAGGFSACGVPAVEGFQLENPVAASVEDIKGPAHLRVL